MHQEDDADERDDQAFLEQRDAEVLDRAMNEV